MEKKRPSQLVALLSGAAMAFSPGAIANPDLDFSQIPEPVVETIFETVDDTEYEEDELIDISWAFVDDPRQNIRRALPGLLKKICQATVNEELGPLLKRLARDRDAAVREALAPVIATWLSQLENLNRTEVIIEWAISDDVAIRQALALALSFDVNFFGLEHVVDHLANDESREVRAEIAHAMQKRGVGDRLLLPKNLAGTGMD